MSFDDPLETLARCHERIEAQLATLENLERHLAIRGPNPIAAAASNDMLRYFDGPGAQHHRDEDEDLFPLLRKRAAALGRNEVAAAMDELEREHATMDAQWQRLRQKLSAIAAREDAAFGETEVERFAWLYRRHMDRERLLVLPFARGALSPQERSELAERMAARRYVRQ